MKNTQQNLSQFRLRLYTVVILYTYSVVVFAQTPENLQSQINAIQKEIESIRGEKFKSAVKIKNQSLEDFGRYIDKMLEKQMPKKLVDNYGRIVKKLGLYRGPEIEDYKSLVKMVMLSQAAAYYDPGSTTFYVVMQNLPAQMMQTVYSHELYHGFQDQHFDLDAFLLTQQPQKLNDDEILARQSVVEGEATYMMTLVGMKMMLGAVPEPSMLQMGINMQAQMSAASLLKMLKSGILSQSLQGDLEKAVAAMDDIPPFLIETLVGAYLKGMKFIFQIQQKGWDKVTSLYSNPPVSSEQILYPEKWLADEKPIKLQWPDFKNQEVFSGWELLEKNTLGEIQWRIIFSEHQMAETGQSAAAGWNGDRFAVLENRVTGKLLLLIYSSWDTQADADEFYTAYEKLLKIKYPNNSENVFTEQMGQDVLIVEGGAPEMTGSVIHFLKSTQKRHD